MYPDPNRVRTERVTVRLDQYEHKLLTAIAEYQGEQVSTLMRTMLISAVEEVMAGAISIVAAAPGDAADIPGAMGTTVQGAGA